MSDQPDRAKDAVSESKSLTSDSLKGIQPQQVRDILVGEQQRQSSDFKKLADATGHKAFPASEELLAALEKSGGTNDKSGKPGDNPTRAASDSAVAHKLVGMLSDKESAEHGGILV